MKSIATDSIITFYFLLFFQIKLQSYGKFE